MSTKFEQLLDLLVNEEMDKANELFHEIVVEKSREIYENLIAEEAEDDVEESMDDDVEESTDDDVEESMDDDVEESMDDDVEEGMDDDVEESEMDLEDSYMMDGDEEGDEMGGDATDDMLGDIEAGGEEDDKSEDSAIMDIKNAIAELEAAFADLEAAQGGDMGGDDMGAKFGDEEDGEETDEMMGMVREYRETVGNDWEKNSMKTPGPVGSGKGDLAGQTSVDSGKSPISSGKGKPTTGATAKNIVAKGATHNEDGTSPKGKVGGLVKSGGEFTKGVEKNIAGSATAKMKDGAALNKQGSGYPGNNKTAAAVGAGTGENSVKGATNDKSVVDRKIG